MCGIAGFIDFTGNSNPETLKGITGVLGHRGPDGSGYEFFSEDRAAVGLGHRRLSIIDLSSSASQPMTYKNLHIVYNGEVFNYEEIKNELLQKGHSFKTSSDTEVILHAFEEWGPEMAHRFIGMFALVIYDSESKKLFCLRDRAGIKPFYYYWKNGLFLFASELKSFHQHPGFKKAIAKEAVQQFIQYGYIVAPLTIFQNTFKLSPGHFMECSVLNGSINTTCYWNVYDAYNKPKLDISYEEAKDEVKELMTSACNYRMVSDVPVGIFLSGGYDSTAVTALIQGYEAQYAKKVAEHLGTEHYEHYCTTKEAQDIIPTIPYYCDEPFGDSSIIPTTLVSKLAREQVTVALSADAGDEVFGGYNKYPMALNLLAKLNAIPGSLKGFTGSLLGNIPDSLLVKFTGTPALAMKKARICEGLKRNNLTILDVMDEFLSQSYSPVQLESFLNFQPFTGLELSAIANGLSPSLSNLEKMMALDYKTYLPDDILVKVDRAGMSVSLEGREPLIDSRLIEFVAQLPAEYKMKNGVKKFILKDIVHSLVPKELMDRPKMGFGVPVADWLRGDLKGYADSFMTDSAFSHGLFKKEGVSYIIKEFKSGNRNYNSLYWFLLMFQMWHKHWMD
ncbi:MAG: asparagine synthase (glutamine-hydrolyzing) [Chitinophagaceae bacterium]|nr:MAG: asparagine synthase (glutamine-hydrolyzing) [Chitinophagaceae bacterium]